MTTHIQGMSNNSLLPILPQSDIEQAAFIIQNAYIPGQEVEQSRRAQQELFELQKRPEAWGLIVPLLEHSDPNVQFFGAHTAQVKIARDWSSFPEERVLDLRNVMLDVAGRSVASGRNKVTLRKLFVAVTTLALKLVPGRPSKWPDWILHVVTSLSGSGASGEYILMFLEIAAEEVHSSDLVSASKAQMSSSLREASPVVIQAVSSSLTGQLTAATEKDAAFKCLEAWIAHFSGDELVAFIPILMHLLNNESTFVGASDALQELLGASPLAEGAGIKALTEPLLAFLEQNGALIVKQTIESGEVDEISHSLCKLLVALGEHSCNYFATRLTTASVQNFITLLSTYTALPGYYGVDEEESEMTLSFWYLLQEALWSVDYVEDNAADALQEWAESVLGNDQDKPPSSEDQGAITQSAAVPIYMALVRVLKQKVTWPPKVVVVQWTKDQREKFTAYRRDVGDVLINAYYILRQDLLKPLLDELAQELTSRKPRDGWENIEAILHCITSVQEAVELQSNPHLERLFGPEISGRLPSTGHDRVRRTMLVLIGTYATWFTVPVDERYLLNALNYVVGALDESSLCLQAANALRDLCDANRQKLAKHIASFGELHSRLPAIPDSEKTKVIQSISSVIQALPPEQEVEPIDAIVSPVVAKLAEALSSASQLPEDARNMAILQIQTLTGCAKGLTRTSDVLFSFEDSDAKEKEEFEKLLRARDDPRMIRLREAIIQAIQGVMAIWSGDALTAEALSNLIVAITSLPLDMTLISLPPNPLLMLVCAALQQNLNAIWLTQAKKLISQLDPPSLSSLLSVPTEEAKATVLSALPIILDVSLGFLQTDNAMESNPDIVQDFFACMEMVAQHFAPLLFQLPPGALDALIQCSIRALALQERYSLVAACTFLVRFINRTVPVETLAEPSKAIIRSHGRAIVHAVLCGIAGASPNSTSQNLVDLMVVLVQRCLDECKVWVPEILFADDFVQTRASKGDKEKFAKAILASRSTKRTREAAAQFAILAKGLSGSNFGLASR